MQRAIFVTALIIPERSAFNYERFARKRARFRALSRGRVASYSPTKGQSVIVVVVVVARSSAISQGMNTEIDSANATMAERKARLRHISCLSSLDTRYILGFMRRS